MPNPKPQNPDASETPHHLGHRDRLRQRFLKGGADALADYEMLELLLFMAIPRKDVKPLAKDLIAKFGSYNKVLYAKPEDLLKVKGLSENSVAAIKVVEASAKKMLKQDIHKLPVLKNWNRLLDYLNATMAREAVEQFRLIFLNHKNEIIADEVQQVGTVDHTPVYPREVVKRALELNATSLVMAHNHPSGDPAPSQSDLDMTNAVIAAAKPLKILVHDHLIISKNGYKSFKEMGLLD